ncbi:tetratricopeptide repeat protein [Iningainema tapete]|uniref:Tetratricopeptide repeat protein n=1 Tax=Iningainema tapete BLCC-T55 TaxID=2748662 RepID=A0A8J7BZ24_9CYAN|nr:tetratricopeptide repeat protein [Iningainema tapete]MBD2775023.1 tetratricopeptide repeat protein [Iningainema tapete BLCC-T55]
MKRIAKAKVTNGIVAGLFLTFAFGTPSFGAAKAGDYRQLGLSYRQQGRYTEAIAAMQKSVELEPENVQGRVNLGWTQHLAGKEKEAAQSLWQAIYLKPFSVPSYNALGIVYLVDGNLPAAVLVHTWAAILKPNNEIAYFNLSLALHQLKVYKLAILAANRAAILEPNNPHPLVASAIAYWDSGDKKTAKQVYTKAINLDSRYSDRTFLNHLKQAAFSSSQIQIVDNIRSSSN